MTIADSLGVGYGVEIVRSPQRSCGVEIPSPVPYSVRSLPVRVTVGKRPGAALATWTVTGAEAASSTWTTTVAGWPGVSQVGTKTLIWVGVTAVMAPG